MDDSTLRAVLTGAGVVLLQGPYRRFSAWLFETVTRRIAYALGWCLGGLWQVLKMAAGK